MIKRSFDIVVSGTCLVTLFIPMLFIGVLVKVMSPGPAIHWSRRVGRNASMFMMPKFRTLRIETPQVATHLLNDPERYMTPVGVFLRKTSLDELPQLWCVLTGAMSLVGPRPALFNQDDLIALRERAGVHELPVGITGWAQVNGRDDLPIPIKVDFDMEYAERQSFFLDIKILALTVVNVCVRKNVRH